MYPKYGFLATYCNTPKHFLCLMQQTEPLQGGSSGWERWTDNFEMSQSALDNTLIFPGAVAGLAVFLSPMAVASSAAHQVVALNNQKRLRNEVRKSRWQSSCLASGDKW